MPEDATELILTLRGFCWIGATVVWVGLALG